MQTTDQLVKAIAQTFPVHRPANKFVFFCVGTDRSTGDSLGPIVGTFLEEAGYKVIGTLENPAHAENLSERINEIPPESVVIGIDACLGMLSSIGKIRVDSGPVKPGAGVGKTLPPVGDYHIIGVVNTGGFMEYFVLQNTRLSLVMDMAKKIVSAIQTAIPICQGNKEVAAAIEPLSNQKTILEEMKMKKATGIVRKVDELGRVVIPIELRRTLGIGEKDALEIFVSDEEIILRKYAPGCVLCGSTDIADAIHNKPICHECKSELVARV